MDSLYPLLQIFSFCFRRRSLSEVTYNDAEKFVLPVTRCKVVKVYDGDTVTVAFYMNDRLFRTQVRLLGIDTPEIKGNSDVERRKAVEARDALNGKIMGKVVVLRKVGTEKYGRLLAEIWYDKENVGDWMVAQGYAVPYDGKAKTFDWDQAPLRHTNGLFEVPIDETFE